MRHHQVVFLLLVVFASTLVSSAFGQWQPNGAAVCVNDSSSQLTPKIVSDGAGGAIVTWFDSRNGSDIYVQRMSAAGIPLWLTAGVALTANPDPKDYPAITSDGAGGAIVTWQDNRNGLADIYVQRVNASGVPQWLANGVALCGDVNDQLLPKIVSDGAGGAIVAWEDYRNGSNSDIYARRVNASGVPQGLPGGYAITVAAGDQDHMSMTPDGAGGAIVTWEDGRGASIDIYAQRVNGSGLVQWTVNGSALCTSANDQVHPMIVADGAGGAIVAWRDFRSSVDSDIYAQRMNAGVAQWAANGVALCTAANDQVDPMIASDGAGGAIVAWDDDRNGNNGDSGIYARRVNAAGVAQWAADGVALSTASPLSNPAIASDGVGGAIVAWLVTYDAGFDFITQRVSASGVPQWAADGIPFTLPGNDRSVVEMVSDGAQGAIVAWQDGGGASFDIYASIINGNTPAGSNIVVSPRDVTTGGNPVTVTFDDVSSGSTSLVTGPGGPALPGTFLAGDGTYYNLSTTATFSGNVEVCITYNQSALTIPESAVQLIHYDATLPGWVNITTSLDTNLNKVCGVATSLSPFVIGAGSVTGIGDDPVPARLALRQNFPNPFNPETVIAFDVPKSGADVRIRIYDVSGRQVRSLVDRPFEPGVHNVSWDGKDDRGQNVGSGVYFYRMDTPSFRQTKKMVLLR